MLSVIEQSGNLIAVKVRGTLQKADYDKFIPIVENKVRLYGSVKLYWEMEDFDGWDLAAALKDLKLDIRHANNFSKVAMVGTEAWQKTLSGLMDVFSKAEVRFFKLSEAEAAKEWVA